MNWACAYMPKGLTESGVFHCSGEISTAVGSVVWIGWPVVFLGVLWMIGWMLPAKSCE